MKGTEFITAEMYSLTSCYSLSFLWYVCVRAQAHTFILKEWEKNSDTLVHPTDTLLLLFIEVSTYI